MSDWVLILAAAAAAIRIGRLATRDTVTKPIRRYIAGWGKTVAEFIHCVWCIEWWVSFAVFATVYAITGHDWSDASSVVVWFGAACATNLAAGWFTWISKRLASLVENLSYAASAYSDAYITSLDTDDQE